MILTIDIGNTAISFNFDSSKTSYVILLESKMCNSEIDCITFLKDFMKSKNIAPLYIKKVAICSVNDETKSFVIESVKKLFNAEIKCLAFDNQDEIELKIDTPEKLGADMIATAIGASILNETATCIIDFGTATTISLVNNEKQFISYNIMPGIKLQFSSLDEGTFKLPNVTPKFSKDILGKNTKDAILSGVLRGHGNAINMFVKSINTSFPHVKFIVTGGFNNYVRDYLNFKYTVENQLIHIGLKHWLNKK